jgi:hypothetical protein
VSEPSGGRGGATAAGRVAVRLVLADGGSFHDLVVRLPAALLDRHDRLIDALREEAAITAELYVDHRRLVAAYLDEAGQAIGG